MPKYKDEEGRDVDLIVRNRDGKKFIGITDLLKILKLDKKNVNPNFSAKDYIDDFSERVFDMLG